VARQLACGLEIDAVLFVELVDDGAGHVELGHAGPAALDDELGAVLLRSEAHRRGLDAHREVLADEHDGGALGAVVESHRKDPRVVVAQPEAGGKHHRVGVVQLDLERAAVGVDRDRRVEPAVHDTQVVEEPQRGAGEVAQLGMMAFGLELGDDDDGQDDGVLGET